jgi:LysR family hydrogen peroxide-inducible transcriptional activator
MDPAPLPFTLRQLQYLLAVAETRNFRKAAALCAVAQPSLSAQVAALEGALGVTVFERGRAGARPTPAGARLLARIDKLLAQCGDLAREARAAGDLLAGPLRLGIIPTLAPYLLPFLAPALRAAFPRLQPLWTEAPTAVLVDALWRGDLEAAFLAREADLRGLEAADLGRDPFLACLPAEHRLARGRGPLALAELDRETLLLLTDGHCLRDQALAACQRSRVEEAGFRATSLATLVQMVASGAGVTLLPRLAAATEGGRAAVKLRPLAEPAPGRTLALAWRPGSFAEEALGRVGRQAARAFLAHPDGLAARSSPSRPGGQPRAQAPAR